MKATLHLAIIVKHLALMFWIGGIWFFGALAAPAIFGQQIQEALGGTEISGEIVGIILKRFSYVEIVCAVLVVLCLVEIHRQAWHHRLLRLAQLGVAVSMLLIVCWYTFLIGPALHDLNMQIGDRAAATVDHQLLERFDTLHAQYSTLMSINGIIGLLLFISSVFLAPTAFRDRNRGILRSLEM